ncbi:cfh [Pungitius sinensis]
MGVKTQSCVLFLLMYTLTLVKSQECTREKFITGPLFDSNFDTTNLAATYPSGEQVRVGCNVGFSGFFKLLCIQGNWQSKGQACQPKSCGHPGEASYADFNLQKGEDFVFGSQVVYTCHKGYQMVSRSNIRRCMAAGWDGVVPVCEAQQCPAIHVDDTVQVVGNTEEAAYGNVIRFSCKSRSLILDGSQELYCDENGAWSGQAPTCKAITCTVPNIQNGFVTGDVDEYNENEYLPFRCNPLYKSVDERPSKCLKSGLRANWSPTPACERIVCKLPQASLEGTQYEPESINVFSPGETVRVICGHKYWIDNHRVNSAMVTCKDTGEWDLRPVCQEVTCSNQRPQHVYNWYVPQRGKITLDETARYTCVRGYKKPDGFNLATCTRGGWKPNPLCQVLCSKPDVPNGIAAGPYNHTVYYTCKKGYKLFTKGWWATARCDKTSGSEKWSGWEKCIENRACGELPAILNGRANRPNEQSSVAQITCNQRYSPNVQELNCRAGEWRSNGYSPQTICTPTAKPCDPPGKVDNAVVEAYCEKPKKESMTITADKETYMDGETLKYTCETSGVEGIATCLNTKWNETEICEGKNRCK